MGVGSGMALKCSGEGLHLLLIVLCVVSQLLGRRGSWPLDAGDLTTSRGTCPLLYGVSGGCICGSEGASQSGRRGGLLLLG